MSLPDQPTGDDPGAEPAGRPSRITADTVEQAIREALRTVRPEAIGLDADADLAADAGLDSVGVMDLVMEIEDRLDVSIPVDTLAEAHTIRDLCTGIVALGNAR